MKLVDMKFKAIMPDGKEYFFGWKDVFGIEDGTGDKSVFGVYANTLQGDIKLTHNSGWTPNAGINEDIEIEVIS